MEEVGRDGERQGGYEEFLGTSVLLSVSSEGGDSAESLPKLTT